MANHVPGAIGNYVDFHGQCQTSVRCAGVQLDLNIRVPYTRSQMGQHLLVDSTGIKFLDEGEWKYKKHGAVANRVSC